MGSATIQSSTPIPRSNQSLPSRDRPLLANIPNQKTVDSITQYIKNKKLSPATYFSAYIQLEHEDQQGQGQFRSGARRRRKAITRVLADDKIRRLLNECDEDIKIGTNNESREEFFSQLRDEFAALASTVSFGQWRVAMDGPESPASYESIDMDSALRDIRERAPLWLDMVDQIQRNKRQPWPSYNTGKSLDEANDDEPNSSRFQGMLYILTVIVMYSYARNTANRAAVDIGLYLEANGVKDRVITFLSRLGLCPSVNSIRTRREEIKKYSEVSIVLTPYTIN